MSRTTSSSPRTSRSRCSPCSRRSARPSARSSCCARSSTCPYDEIAEAVGKSPAAVRQIAHRAKDHVAARRPRVRVVRSEHEEVVERLVAALNTGDLQGLMDVLAPDVVSVADGGGKVRGAARRPIVGADKLAGYLLGGMAKYEVQPVSTLWVNGRRACASRSKVRWSARSASPSRTGGSRTSTPSRTPRSSADSTRRPCSAGDRWPGSAAAAGARCSWPAMPSLRVPPAAIQSPNRVGAMRRVGAGQQLALVEFGTEVPGERVERHLAWVAPEPQLASHELLEPELLGPANSTTPFTGGPMATVSTAAAMSSAAIGWMSACESRTMFARSRHPRCSDEFEELGPVHDRVGRPECRMSRSCAAFARSSRPRSGQPSVPTTESAMWCLHARRIAVDSRLSVEP